ncbi:hypothetical protein C9374_008484 [Naegleria lovaniensis]|uniref:Uncharacterized protein n=1 Tax=Naegleria lovaniensis TaxID=51637 RepID=A0AA88KHM7_NAELO|nr:uncharacterized protein C9374_008484 [Naegleria lovaniensis]KAG2378341.1 hypothetical protein C9374_008484 [Naegleria lovaniensis]
MKTSLRKEDHHAESVWYCGLQANSGFRYEQGFEPSFLKLLYKPSCLSRTKNIKSKKKIKLFCDEEKKQYGDDEPLKFSFVCSGGDLNVSYSLIFLWGQETKFFLSISSKLHYLRKVTFHELFKGMKKANLGLPTSKEMKRVVCNNCSHVIFEMMDDRLFIYDVESFKMKPFKVHRRGDLIAIGAGTMSPYFLLYTKQDPTQFIAYQCETETEEAFPVPDDKTKIKFMTSYCNDLFIFILEDNKFYIRKYGSEACGFDYYPKGRMVYVETPFEKRSPVIQISSGYAHLAILLQSGAVFVRGLNDHGQLTSHPEIIIEDLFFELNISSPIQSLCCGSICTCLISVTGEIIFIGPVVLELKKQSNIDQKFRGYNKIWVLNKEYDDQEVSLGPWHAFIYRKRFPIRKSDWLFFLKLKELTGRSALSDIMFSFNENSDSCSPMKVFQNILNLTQKILKK